MKRFAFLALLISGCAASQPPSQVVQPLPLEPPPPTDYVFVSKPPAEYKAETPKPNHVTMPRTPGVRRLRKMMGGPAQ